MAQVRRFDHVGLTVADLDVATAFFVGLGFQVEGRTVVEGEFIDTVSGIPDSCSEIVMLRLPGGGTGLELARFVRPAHGPGTPDAIANELGLRSVGVEVDDLDEIVDRLAPTASASSEPSGSTRTTGAWRTCAGRRASSSRWPSVSAERSRRRRRRAGAAGRRATTVPVRRAGRRAGEAVGRSAGGRRR